MTTTGDTTISVPARTDPSYVWALASSPLLAVALSMAFPGMNDTDVLGATIIVNSVLAIADRARLSKVGIEINVLWALFLVPVYLIVRTSKARSTPAIPIVWFAVFLTSLGLSNQMAGPGLVSMDAPALERQLESAIQAQTGESTDVRCSPEVDATVGAPFPCDVLASDGSYHVYVTVADEDGDYDWQLTE